MAAGGRPEFLRYSWRRPGRRHLGYRSPRTFISSSSFWRTLTPEFALALDGDDPGVGQLVVGVDLELDALLEVDQVEVDFLGARSGGPGW